MRDVVCEVFQAGEFHLGCNDIVHPEEDDIFVAELLLQPLQIQLHRELVFADFVVFIIPPRRRIEDDLILYEVVPLVGLPAEVLCAVPCLQIFLTFPLDVAVRHPDIA